MADEPPQREPTRIHRPEGEDPPAPTRRDEFVDLQIEDTRLVRRIGEGGMGVIYEGWQDPPGRTVAVKLLRQAVASDEARFRFEHEARVLASLRHPAIAHVHSVGTHAAGRELPFFFMEYVPDARPIAEYVRETSLGLDDTLRLFEQVCRGVQAGHAKGVIHRDLKPANILVDGDGNPKIIDFGIARVAPDAETDATPKTTTGEVVGTVPYMAPEQFTGRREDVDVRTDVYALGVVLFETLTGELPYEFGERAILDVIRMIQADRPRAPESLRPELAGDVSVIIGKALAKDPRLRYVSAAALADDLQRYLEQRPILARPPSLRYQIGMYAKRRKAAFAAILGIAASIVFALIAVTLYARSESQARSLAEREETKARTLLHESARFVPELAETLDNELATVVGTSGARRVMAEQLEKLAARLSAVDGAASDPEVAHAMGAAELAVANIRAGLGGANLGDGSSSLERFHRAVGHHRRAYTEKPDEPRFRTALVAAKLTLSDQQQVAGLLDESRATLAKAAELLTAWEAETPDDPDLLAQRIDYERAMGHLAWRAEKPEEALAAYERAHARVIQFPWTEEQAPARAVFLLQSHLDLATTHVRMARIEEAGGHIKKLVTLSDTLDPSRSNAQTRDALWHVHMKLGEFAETGGNHAAARDRHQRALTVAQQAAEDDPHDAAARQRVRVSRGALGATLERLGEHGEAYEHHREGLVAVREERSRDPDSHTLEWDLRVALVRLAAVEGQRGEHAQAQRLLDEARIIQARRAAENPHRRDEISGVADVEYAAASVALAKAQQTTTIDENIAAYEEAAARLKAAVAALEKLEAAERLTPPDKTNLALWRETIATIEVAIDKFKSMR